MSTPEEENLSINKKTALQEGNPCKRKIDDESTIEISR